MSTKSISLSSAISALPDYSYEGYYWLSNESNPKVLMGEPFPKDVFAQLLPFVVEACFYAPQERLSVHIRYREGESTEQRYSVSQYELTPEQVRQARGYAGMSYKKEKPQLDYRMCELWEEVEGGPSLEGMPTLALAATVFAGFIQ